MKYTLFAAAAALTLTACAAKTPEVEGGEPVSAKANGTWLAKNAKAEGVVTTESGLQYKVIQDGLENGAVAAPGQGIAAHYHGVFTDGKVFDSSYNRGQPLVGPSNGFIAGWNEALGEMKVCEARTLYIGPDLGYGDADRGPIPGGSTLVFNMQVLAVQPDPDSDAIFNCPDEKILAGPEAY
jgi:FKBP-type peptidyl-prolyl cis-trans isomerase